MFICTLAQYNFLNKKILKTNKLNYIKCFLIYKSH